jgi:two-component system sensor histidine kinase/response regulator
MEDENVVNREDASAEVLILDWDHALKRVDGVKDALQDIVEVFCTDECPRLMQNIRDGLVKEDADLVGRAAHTLKSSADIFGAKRAFDAAETLEKSANESDLQGAARTWKNLEWELTNLQAALANHEF